MILSFGRTRRERSFNRNSVCKICGTKGKWVYDHRRSANYLCSGCGFDSKTDLERQRRNWRDCSARAQEDSAKASERARRAHAELLAFEEQVIQAGQVLAENKALKSAARKARNTAKKGIEK